MEKMRPMKNTVQKKHETKTERLQNNGWLCLKVVKKRKKNLKGHISTGR